MKFIVLCSALFVVTCVRSSPALYDETYGWDYHEPTGSFEDARAPQEEKPKEQKPQEEEQQEEEFIPSDDQENEQKREFACDVFPSKLTKINSSVCATLCVAQFWKGYKGGHCVGGKCNCRKGSGSGSTLQGKQKGTNVQRSTNPPPRIPPRRITVPLPRIPFRGMRG